MSNNYTLFYHEAIPSWSGYIYQGEIAIYLAIKTINDLLIQGVGKDEIAEKYKLELEWCEDVAIKKEDKYISIHQVKNKASKNMGDYKKDIIQLMLEVGFHNKLNQGKPKAYLHTSIQLSKNANGVKEKIKQWKITINNFYKEIKDITETDKNGLPDEFEIKVNKILENDPIKLEREIYKKEKEKCKNAKKEEIINSLKDFLKFLEDELAVEQISEDVDLYEYEEDNLLYCSGSDLWKKIKEQIKKYKEHQNIMDITEEDSNCILLFLYEHMRNHILDRQRNNNRTKLIGFNQIIDIMDSRIEDNQEKKNDLALRKLYDAYIEDYCSICREEKEKDCQRCNLNKNTYRKTDLNREEFFDLCYGYNPDCVDHSKSITSINKLLNEDGMKESVFEVISSVDKEKILKEESKLTRLVVSYHGKSQVTAISNNRAKEVVRNIKKSIENNGMRVAALFEMDNIITTRLEVGSEIWDSEITDITEYAKEQSLNICNPKQPNFVKAEKVIEKLSQREEK